MAVEEIPYLYCVGAPGGPIDKVSRLTGDILATYSSGLQVFCPIDIKADILGNFVVGGALELPAAPAILDKHDKNGNHLWYKTGSADTHHVSKIAIDSSGNIYAAGFFASDKNLRKYDGNGNLLWAVSVGENPTYALTSICIGYDGNIYVGGYPNPTANIWKLNPSGELLGSYSTGTVDGAIWSLSSDSEAIYVAGYENPLSQNAWKLGGWSYDTGGWNTSGIWAPHGIFIVGRRANNKSIWLLDIYGNLMWSYDTGYDTDDIIADTDSNCYVVGGGIRKLNSAGELQWYKNYGTQALSAPDLHL